MLLDVWGRDTSRNVDEGVDSVYLLVMIGPDGHQADSSYTAEWMRLFISERQCFIVWAGMPIVWTVHPSEAGQHL